MSRIALIRSMSREEILAKLPTQLLERLTVIEGGCWPVSGYSVDGYRRVQLGGRQGRKVYAHRLMLESLVGPLPPEDVTDHLCRNRACSNPFHLDIVTVAVNNWRGMVPTYVAARENRCLRGHPFDEQNTRRQTNGRRTCRQCARMRDRERYRLTHAVDCPAAPVPAAPMEEAT